MCLTSRLNTAAARSASEEFPGPDHQQKEAADYPSPKGTDKDEEIIKVYDGNSSMKRRTFRTITIPRNATREQIVAAALRAFHIHDDPRHYIITDVYDPNEKELGEFMPVPSLTRREGKRAGIYLRYRPPNPSEGSIRIYPGKLNVNDTYRVIPVTNDTSVEEVMVSTLDEFGLDSHDINRYRLVEVSLEKGAVHERTMDNNESPWEIVKNVARESVRQKENTRFYLQTKDEVYCSNVAIFVCNLPPNLSQVQYETILVRLLGKRKCI